MNQKEEEEIEFKLTEFTFQDQTLDQLLLGKEGVENPDVNMILVSDDTKAKFEIKKQNNLAVEYFYLLAVAHECMAQKPKNKNNININIDNN